MTAAMDHPMAAVPHRRGTTQTGDTMSLTDHQLGDRIMAVQTAIHDIPILVLAAGEVLDLPRPWPHIIRLHLQATTIRARTEAMGAGATRVVVIIRDTVAHRQPSEGEGEVDEAVRGICATTCIYVPATRGLDRYTSACAVRQHLDNSSRFTHFFR